MDRKNSVNEKRQKIKELVEWEIKAEPKRYSTARLEGTP